MRDPSASLRMATKDKGDLQGLSTSSALRFGFGREDSILSEGSGQDDGLSLRGAGMLGVVYLGSWDA